jgi:nucleoid-associated protein YgaU
MTRTRGIEIALWVLAAIGAGAAVVGWRAATAIPARDVQPAVPVAHRDPAADSQGLQKAAAQIAATDPFRLDRHPASVPYRAGVEYVAPPPAPPKPVLVLKGTVGQARGWAAMIDGIPGRDVTALVRAGDTLSGLKIKRVDRDTVIVLGMDTTWKLTVRRAWQ